MNREKFPILGKIVYLDSAAGGLKPTEVVKAINDFYLKYPINTHSDDSRLGVLVSQKVADTRQLVAQLVNAEAGEVIFTSGTTDSLNKAALMLENFLKPGDEIVLNYLNHVSQVIPWLEIAKKKNAKVVYSWDIVSAITNKTKIVAYAQTNNTLQQKIDVQKIYKAAKAVQALVVNDAAQAIVHEKVTLEEADMIAFSGNKIFGPTGIGALVVKKKLLTKLKPTSFGGGAVAAIKKTSWIPKESIMRFEPGTLNVAGIIGLGAAINYFNSLGNDKYKIAVSEYAFDQISKIENVKVYSQRGDSIILFNIKGFASQDVVSYLGYKDIILRGGQHCSKVALKKAEYTDSIRVSLAHYNNKQDIDKMVKAIKEGGDFLDFV